jgi:integrase/recombinase XerC
MPDPLVLDECFARFITDQRARGHAAKTILYYEECFHDFTRYLADTDRPADTSVLTAAAMSAFGAWLRETPIHPWRGRTTRSVFSIHGRLKALRALCRFLMDAGDLDQVPRVTLPKLPETIFPVLTSDQLVTLFSCRHLCAQGDQAVRNRALLSLMLDTGLRVSEVAAIRLADIDRANQLIRVRGKGGKERIVFYQTGAARELEAWLSLRGEDEEPLFWLSARGIQQLFKRIRTETGLPVHAHLLRHQCATMLVNANTDIHTVRRVLGHAQLSTTERYLSLSTADLQAKHAAGSPFETLQGMLPQPERRGRRKRLTLG